MTELVTSVHIHTTYSDGNSQHREIAEIAARCKVDVLVVTDHNVLVGGLEGYHEANNHRTLLLVGEEIHNRLSEPQKNHLLVMGTDQELSSYASEPQTLIDQVKRVDGLSFLAHPVDPAMPSFHEPDISWVDWNIQGFTGIELWNGLSELKSAAKNKWEAIFYALFPEYLAHGPLPEVLERWDALIRQNRRVAAIGGVDAHALRVKLGPFRKTIFPYGFHFQTIHTHLITPGPLSGDLVVDRRMVLEAFREGHSFVGYDLPAPTNGFRFSAQGKDQTASMGDEIKLNQSLTLQIRLPFTTECRLLKDGKVVRTWLKHDICTYNTNQPGVYRVECFLEHRGKRRGWIFSNPIYVRS